MALKLAESISEFWLLWVDARGAVGRKIIYALNNQPLVFATKSHVLFSCLLIYGPQRYWPSSWNTPHSVS